MRQRQMSEREIQLLGSAINMLTEEEQQQILGGTDDTISITDKQCDRIKQLCAMEDTPTSREIMVCTNYGGCCPRPVFERYQDQENVSK